MSIYTIEALQRAYQAGKPLKYICFWGHTPPADGGTNQSCLSQWWMRDFTIENVTYNCTEQYMMAEKARLFHDDAMLADIMAATHPKAMKAFGRAVRGFVEEKWDAHCYDIVKRGNAAKFGQNEELRTYLLATGSRVLVEASPYDRIWGIGMGKDHPDVHNPMKWRGRNLLGFALMEVRDELLGG